jgi:hypothetical protein
MDKVFIVRVGERRTIKVGNVIDRSYREIYL